MKKILILFFSIFLILVGCDKEEAKDQLPKMLNVQLLVSPNPVEVNETVSFQAKVTYGDEAVTDADDVSFEIWRAGSEERGEFPAEHSKEGLYEYEKAFTEAGTYYVYAHVTARRMHTMPKAEFVVGTPDVEESSK